MIERLGLGYDTVRDLNPKLVYGSISGYGETGPWAAFPGRYLLVQTRIGVMWLTGNDDQGPAPMGVAVADKVAGATLVRGVLAALVRRGITGRGRLVQTSLTEVLIDLQFDVLATCLNDVRRVLSRAAADGAHSCPAVPYGIYAATDGRLALAMVPLPRLMEVMGLSALAEWSADLASRIIDRNRIKTVTAEVIAAKPLAQWQAVLEAADVWCVPVLDWEQMLTGESFDCLDILQTATRASDDVSIRTTRAPLRIDRLRPACLTAAPRVGEDNAAVPKAFGL